MITKRIALVIAFAAATTTRHYRRGSQPLIHKHSNIKERFRCHSTWTFTKRSKD
jgi:hypothetical protein